MKILELQYLPQAKYFAVLLHYQDTLIDGFEHYEKQTYRNRCEVLGPNGVNALTVPVVGGRRKILSKDIRIDQSQKWQNQHWRTLQAAYGRAPYFEYYADEILTIYQKNHSFLFDLSLDLLTQCLDFLQFDISLNQTEKYIDLTNQSENDLRSIISPKHSKDLRFEFSLPEYQQVFGSNFAQNLSVVDLIFCEGPNSGAIIKSGMGIEQF